MIYEGQQWIILKGTMKQIARGYNKEVRDKGYRLEKVKDIKRKVPYFWVRRYKATFVKDVLVGVDGIIETPIDDLLK
jgi:hypothetical protein